jgi:hypothetical protein
MKPYPRNVIADLRLLSFEGSNTQNYLRLSVSICDWIVFSAIRVHSQPVRRSCSSVGLPPRNEFRECGSIRGCS